MHFQTLSKSQKPDFNFKENLDQLSNPIEMFFTLFIQLPKMKVYYLFSKDLFLPYFIK